jgi:hypothetical protein
MSEELMNFIEQSKAHVCLYQFLSMENWINVPERAFHNFRLKINSAINKFEDYLKREEAKYKRVINREDSLTKTATRLRNKYKSREKKEKIAQILLEDSSDNKENEIPCTQAPNSTPENQLPLNYAPIPYQDTEEDLLYRLSRQNEDSFCNTS